MRQDVLGAAPTKGRTSIGIGSRELAKRITSARSACCTRAPCRGRGTQWPNGVTSSGRRAVPLPLSSLGPPKTASRTAASAFEQVRRDLAPFYSSIGRPSIDPELMIRTARSAQSGAIKRTRAASGMCSALAIAWDLDRRQTRPLPTRRAAPASRG
jgi:hypothetical protein